MYLEEEKRRQKDANYKQDELYKRWNETKDRCEISLEEYLMDTTTLHDIYEKDHKGSPLTLDTITQMMKLEDDVDVVGATSIVQPNVIDGNIVEV